LNFDYVLLSLLSAVIRHCKTTGKTWWRKNIRYIFIYKWLIVMHGMTLFWRYLTVKLIFKMTKIQMYLAIVLTMLPTLVTASPIPSLTRDNVAKPNKNDLKVVVSRILLKNITMELWCTRYNIIFLTVIWKYHSVPLYPCA
jgi:hypothetical protein